MNTTTTTTAPTLAELRADAVSLMAIASATGALSDAIAAHNAAARHDTAWRLEKLQIIGEKMANI